MLVIPSGFALMSGPVAIAPWISQAITCNTCEFRPSNLFEGYNNMKDLLKFLNDILLDCISFWFVLGLC